MLEMWQTDWCVNADRVMTAEHAFTYIGWVEPAAAAAAAASIIQRCYSTPAANGMQVNFLKTFYTFYSQRTGVVWFHMLQNCIL